MVGGRLDFRPGLPVCDPPRLRLLPDPEQYFRALAGGWRRVGNTDLPPEVLFVPKPFSTKMLLACVRQALDDR
jgi:hypothetical protein